MAQFLKISENNRFLVTKNDEPFFWLGDTAWEMLHRLNKEEMEHYMRNCSEKGFTVIQTVILGELDGLTVPNMEGELPFIEFDSARPNEAFFEIVDYAVKKAEELGLIVALLPTWHLYVRPSSNPFNDEEAYFNAERAFAYGKFLGARYKDAPNIVWVLGGDVPPDQQIDMWDAMAAGLKEGDTGDHLVTYHPNGKHTSSTLLHDREWLDFNMVQTGHLAPSFNVYDYISNDYELKPVKPVLNGEPAYEEMPIWFNAVNPRFDDYEVRKQAYWSVFAGAFGHTYGNNNIWQIFRENDPGRISPNRSWDKALESPGAAQMVHLRRLIESRPFLTRIPDQEVLKDENPSFAADHIQVCRDGTQGEKDASYIMVYLPLFRSLSIDTSVIAGEKLKVWWFNPRNGQAFLQSEIENSAAFSFSNWDHIIKEGQGGPDWVVVIDDAAAAYPTPGLISNR
jgi:hypothetical protein